LSSPWSEAGDRIAVLRDVRGEQIHLWGIDCPDKNQDFGTKAKHATSILVFAKVMEVESVTTDRYGRTVALVRVGATIGPRAHSQLPSRTVKIEKLSAAEDRGGCAV
jgi:Staphylococcal nuclease homologue